MLLLLSYVIHLFTTFGECCYSFINNLNLLLSANVFSLSYKINHLFTTFNEYYFSFISCLNLLLSAKVFALRFADSPSLLDAKAKIEISYQVFISTAAKNIADK